uniref:Uncharacterized protein n=2 Tax=Membranoptera TaxID=158697 RepID=A0A1L1Y9P3_9FLOR|nr:conserved hypothetical plastid protein 56 [Membranoptera weeksiae]YP_009332811.1 hypothetical protein [Membranoptera tenuis]AHZ94605.1 conserved hypothetical plastid protein 56 [Membranoptera weeksiae]AKL79067.1 hypothetical protein [Membranoptera tenuis]
MEISYLHHNINSFQYSNTSFIIQFIGFKDFWIFNCCEGCQYILTNKKLRINNISKIIITDLHINNLSGLIGLLSSLNLIGRIKCLHIYGPKDLASYLDLGKKYSHTNFNYIIYIHILGTGLVINHYQYRIYTFIKDYQYEFIIMQSEQYGTFIINKAKKNNLIASPLYGELKKSLHFILPDSFILNGKKFTLFNLFGNQLSFLLDKYYNRVNFESNINSNIIFYK